VINASGLCAATNFVPAASVTLSLRDSCGADGPGCAAQPLLDRALASVTSVIVGTGAERIGGQIWERLAPGADSYIVRNIKYCEPSAHGNCYPGNKRGLGHLVRHIEATEYACAPSGNCTETYPVEVVLIAGWE
jgi:hypothetical protein